MALKFLVLLLNICVSISLFADETTHSGQGGDIVKPVEPDVSVGLKISDEIRRALANDSVLSVPAKNVKILVSVDGRVMLQGSVPSNDAKTKIAFIAAKMAGPGKVENQLEIKASK